MNNNLELAKAKLPLGAFEGLPIDRNEQLLINFQEDFHLNNLEVII